MQIHVSYKLNTKYIFSIHIKGMRQMSIKRMLNSKKAISPILATLLLIVIAVAAIVVTYAWITTYIGNTSQQAGFMPYKANVAFSTDKITIDIGNSGTSSGQIVQVYVGTSASNTTSLTPDPNVPITIAAGGGGRFVFNYTLLLGKTHYL